ncbi:MAG: accessory factor UbiK family protein [Methylophilaceae bacterium]|nr:accessory factor UbiK family protein [Methylophilaceae bacterium]
MKHIEIAEDLSRKIKETLSNSPISDFEHNIRALLQSTFTKIELVSREEFDVQTEILRRTQEKLATLEKKLETLEKQSK